MYHRYIIFRTVMLLWSLVMTRLETLGLDTSRYGRSRNHVFPFIAVIQPCRPLNSPTQVKETIHTAPQKHYAQQPNNRASLTLISDFAIKWNVPVIKETEWWSPHMA